MASRAMMVGMLACQSAALMGAALMIAGRKNSRKCLAAALFDLNDLAALIVAALGAGTMRQLALVAIGTLRQRWRRQMIVRPALGCARLGMTPFRIRHENLTTWIA